MSLRRFRADLHVHSCLSPCGGLDIYPCRIVKRALEAGLEIVAVTDHNSAENAAATVIAARGTRLTVLPGMEIASSEEVHVLGLFETMDDILPVQAEVFRGLPDVPAGAPFVADQVIVDAEDGVTGFSPRFLMAATRLDVRGVVDLIHSHGGLAIAAHVDRPAFGVISQLGFVPPDLELDALEVSPLVTDPGIRAGLESGARLPVVRFSDAHEPDEIGRASTAFRLAAPRLSEIRKALRGSGGRRIYEP
jgi:3',5'-nucleoside bisphosphate phosphatase